MASIFGEDRLLEGSFLLLCSVSSRRWSRVCFMPPTLRSRWSLSMGLLRFSLFEAVEKSVQYHIRDFLFPFELACGGMALRDIVVVKE